MNENKLSEIPLNNVANVLSGFAFKSSDYVKNGHFLIRIGNVQSTGLVLDKPKYVALDSRTKRFELCAGDILTSLTGNIGRVAIVKENHLPAVLNQRVAKITTIDSRELDPRYLYHFLSSNNFQKALEASSHGVAQKNVSPKAIGDIEIPLPFISEQKRIVAILDETFAGIDVAIANTEKNLANARELFESYLDSAFTDSDKEWRRESFGDLAAFKNGVNYTKNSKGEEVKIVGVREFKSDYWVPTEKLEAVQVDGQLSEAYELRKDDILIVRSNGNKELIGRCLLTGPIEHKTTHSGFTIRARLISCDLLPEYLVYYLKCYQSRQSLTQFGGGANISSLNQKGLASLSVRFPGKDEQGAIVSRIVDAEQSIQQLESIYQQKLNVLSELKQSLLQKAFSGELTAEAIEKETDEAVA